MLFGRVKLNEIDRLGISPRCQHHLHTVSQQVQSQTVSTQCIGLAHRTAQGIHGNPCLFLGLHSWIDFDDGLNQQLFNQRVIQRTLINCHGGLVSVCPAQAGFIGCGAAQPRQPLNDREFDVTGFAHGVFAMVSLIESASAMALPGKSSLQASLLCNPQTPKPCQRKQIYKS